MQYEFQFMFPYPAGCFHVPKHGSDGFAIDDCARICGPACAVTWALAHGRALTGVRRIHSHDGGMQYQSFTTKKPHEIMRPSMAHLAALMRGS